MAETATLRQRQKPNKEKEEPTEKEPAEKGEGKANKKAKDEDGPRPEVGAADTAAKKQTVGETFMKSLTNTTTLIMMAAMGMSLWNNRNDKDQSWGLYVVPVVLVASLLLGSVLVTKLENSEWRMKLRAEAAAKEREEMAKKGLTQHDLNEAAMNMGMQPTNIGQG
ncbi:unnamed protein product [Effrenium voratum]|uniref:Uncharacterized protein n=1 Tax=Effrenium voratum TaxID=2562239 RepID=A0AA36MZZ0_9DINO|nr:unnamed protein product [Effrenium voratum]CAJ1439345.1 unnamed protein product [Effrenium voratum]